MRFVTDRSSTYHRFIAFIALLVGAFAFSTGCEIDPDDDFPLPPVVPAPDNGEGNGENGGGENGNGENGNGENGNGENGNGENGNGENGNGENGNGGGACFGHCDCTPEEYCATVGTCQPRVAGAGHYCCDRVDDCPAGEVCHIAGTINETGICAE